MVEIYDVRKPPMNPTETGPDLPCDIGVDLEEGKKEREQN